MNFHTKTLSLFGNVRDKFDSLRSDVDNIINQVPFQYAENQLFTAGENVKQFCSEFMEEMLPESVINSLKEKTSASLELLRTDINQGPIKGLSDDSSPSTMEVVENEHTDSSLATETSVGKEFSFEEIHMRETTFPSQIPHVDVHCHNGKCNDHNDLPLCPSSRPAKERELSDSIDGLSADAVELSTVHSPSSISPAEERKVSDPDDTQISDLNKELSAIHIFDNSNVTTGFSENRVLENEVSSLGHKVHKELIDLNDRSDERTAEETEDTHAAKAAMAGQSSTTEMSDNKCIMLDSGTLCLVLDLPEENLTCQVYNESIDLNDRSDDRKAEETEDTHVTKAGIEVLSCQTENIDDKCIMLDSSNLCLIPDLPEENPTSQGSACKSCLRMKSGKECKCKVATSSGDGDAESDDLGGNSVWLLPLQRGESGSLDQDFRESDWVIV